MTTVHGGVKFYRGSAAAARSYVEADRSRADDYYLAEGTGVADAYVAATDDALVIDRRRPTWMVPPTSGGSPATTSTPVRRRAGCDR